MVAKIVAESTNGKVIDVAKIADAVRPRLDTEEGPFEGRIPDAEVEKDILKIVNTDKDNGDKFFYIFDGQHHESVDASADFLINNMGTPTYMITCSAAASDIENRYKEKNEIAEDLPEEEKTNLAEKGAQAKEDLERLRTRWADKMNRIKQIDLETGCSKESLIADIRSKFSAKVILVNHEKRINVDTACSNLAIKYNMLYMSVYQLIKNEICAETGLGRALRQSKREKAMDFGAAS